MNPSHLDLAGLTEALDIYVGLAWVDGVRPKPELEGESLEEVLSNWQQEGERFCLRLGNSCYPHMKIIVERALNCGRFFLSVDTHDQASICDSAEGRAAWGKIQRFNARLARRIDAAWNAAGLPTLRTIKEVTQASTRLISTMGPKILVVDDEEDAARLYALQLSAQGFRADIATCGKDALESMRERQPALVILDYMMPELSGREVAEAMRADPELKHIPVIIATYAQTAGVDFSAADAVVAKPFRARKLAETINGLLATRV